MAGIIRDILEAQAPGVFFGDQASGLSYSSLIKSGNLLKLGRGRGIIGGFLSKKWADRTFNVYEDFRMQYLDKDTLRGEFPVDTATIAPVAKEEERADGKDFVFEIITKEDERILLAASSEEERAEWIATLRDVSTGKFKLNRYLALITQALQLGEGNRVSIEFDPEEFKRAMNADGYGQERMMEILEQYLINLHSHLVRYIAEDGEFRNIFLARFDTLRIRVSKAEDTDTSRGYYRTHFAGGELHIHYIQVWTNVNQCGEDLVHSVSEGEPIPYLVHKSIRRYEPVLKSYLTGIERLLGITHVTYDYSLRQNYHAMIKGGYGPDRFGEIFIQEHLKTFIEKLSRWIAADSAGFIPAFNERFLSKRIVIKPADNPDTVKNYYDSSFDHSGDLVIVYRAVWTNLSCLGEDFPGLLSGGSIPYKVSKSIRDKHAVLQAHLQKIESLFGITGVSYDYAVADNLPAMTKAGYGEERFGEIYLDEHLKSLISNLERFVNEDRSFIAAFNQKFFGRRIIVKISPNPDNVKDYFESSFTEDGSLLILYRAVWTNIANIGRDIPSLLSEGDVPFIVAESIHKYQSTLQSHIAKLERLFGVSGITYDYSIAENLTAMRASSYKDDRFGEIFIDEHLKNLINNLERFIQEDSTFVKVFNAHFFGKKIVIRPSRTPDLVKNYYDSSFTSEGHLHIVYRAVWTNIGNLGRDIPEILVEDSVPYIVAVSIRKYQPQLQSHIAKLEQLLQVSGISYDYSVAENLPALLASSYRGERFGEIFLDEHLKSLVSNIERHVRSDSGFVAAVQSKFFGRRIIIKISPAPDTVRNYYESSFTSDGNLLILYRAVWTNIGNLGQDLPERL